MLSESGYPPESDGFPARLLRCGAMPVPIRSVCGDMSFTAALCFDFEVYSEAQKRWLEVSSVSNFDTYQANRLKCRYRSGKTHITTTETENTVREFQLLEQAFYMIQHFLM